MMNNFIDYTDHQFINRNNPYKPLNWRAKKQPIYRLLDKKKWLDGFFEKGELALSCFSNFRNYPNEIQGDKGEGKGLIWFDSSKGDTHAFGYESGLNSYVLCCTLDITEKIISDFNAVGAIKIYNPTYFSLEVMAKINNCDQGLEGKCNYVENRVYKGNSEKIKDILDNPDFIKDPIFYHELLTSSYENELFLKELNYKYQNEYRMFWFCDKLINDSLIVNCPDAINFCERIDF